ncbi:hypothetical protein D3C71_1194520 [compost metagenome]
MVDHGVAAFGDAVAEADRTIGVEGLTLDVEVVRGDLGKGAAEGVAGDGDLGSPASKCGVLCCDVQSASGQSDCIGRLHICPRDDHASVSQDRIAANLFGSAMGDDDFVSVRSLVDRALITIEAIVDVLKDLVLVPIERDFFFLARGAAPHCAILVGIIGERGVVLRSNGHWVTSLALRLIVNNLPWSSAT